MHMSVMPRTTFVLSASVCLLALAVRVPLLVKFLPVSASPTENERVARSLVRGEGWANAFGEATGPTAHVAPAYPVLLAALYRVFGDYDSERGRIAQSCLSIAISLAVLLTLPWIGRLLGLSKATAWLAAFAAAWLPTHRWSEVWSHHEQGLAALVVLWIVGVCARLRREDWSNQRTVLLAAGIISIALLACPNVLAGVGLFAMVELVRLRRNQSCVPVVRGAAIIAAAGLVVMTPWCVRNYVVLGGFVPLRSNLGLEIAVGNRDLADGHTYATGFHEAHPFGHLAERAHYAAQGELAYMRRKSAIGCEWIASHPWTFAWLTLRRAFLFWFGCDERWYGVDLSWSARARWTGFLGCVASAGLVRLLVRRRFAGSVLTCACLGMALPYLFTHVEHRYSQPVFPLFVLAACSLVTGLLGAGVRRIHALLWRRDRTDSATAATAATAAALGDSRLAA
jgi:hypothetical protein